MPCRAFTRYKVFTFLRSPTVPCRASRVVPVPSCKVGSNNTALINFNTRFFLFIFAHHNVLILSRTELSFFRWRRALLYFWGSFFSSGSYSFAGRFSGAQ